MKGLISIIIPAYQAEEYLERCIESVLKQTYSNIEVIIVDDGSLDRTGTIADKFCETDPRIKVIHQENKGLSGARNSAIEVAQGEYITFVDADDFIHPQMLTILLSEIQKNQAEIAISRFNVVNEMVEYASYQNYKVSVLNKVEAIKNLFNRKSFYTVTACNKLYRTILFKEVRYPVGRIHEDVATTYKLLAQATKIVDIELPLYCYYQRMGSIMRQGMRFKKLDALLAYDEMMEYFKDDLTILGIVKKSYKSIIEMYYAYVITEWVDSEEKKRQFKQELLKRYKQITGNNLPIFKCILLNKLICIKRFFKASN